MSFFVGQKAELSKQFTEKNVNDFSELIGDYNPIHLNEEYAKTTIFRSRIIHGTFYSGLIGTVLAMKLPGAGTILLNENFRFIKPVYINDTITASVEITGINNDKITLKSLCVNQNKEVVLTGEVLIKKLNA